MTAAPPPRRAGTAASSLAESLSAATRRLDGCSDSPRLDAEVLLLAILGRDRAYLRAWPERHLTDAEAERFREWVERRASGEPVAYLTGEREFWSRPFAVTPAVLIPRPETELLVELALASIPPDRPADVLDLGTGSGIIAVTLAAERPAAHVTATDACPAALAVARRNAVRNGISGIRFCHGNWFEALPGASWFDLIVSNPPYIAVADPHLRQGDLRFEPLSALAAGPDGLADLRTIAQGARSRLHPGGHLLLEHGYDQADALAACLAALGYRDITLHRDLQGHSRAVMARRP